MHEDLPQTVREAIAEGWQYLAVQCFYCHRNARIRLSSLRPGDRIAAALSRVRCTKCDGRRPQIAVKLGYEHTVVHEKQIGVEGNKIFKVGMT